MKVHEYFEEIKKLQTELVDIENTMSKLRKEKARLCEMILEVTREYKDSPDEEDC